jgi:thiol-disulfide isomerase/thioredoxin
MHYQTRLTFNFLAVFFFAILIAACSSSRKIEKLDDSEIPKLVSQNKIVVLNFWATWCQPCVEEIPIFVKFHQQHPKIEIIGISMDEPDQLPAVDEFAKKHGMDYKVVLRVGENFENMVNSIDPSWMGALPATFVFKDDRRVFSKTGLITEQELLKAIQ